MKVLLFALLAVCGSAHAKYGYDQQTGNSYNTTPAYNGGVDVDGYNGNTGNTWHSHIDKNGDQNGVDGNSNSWSYDKNSKTYINYGTGVMCTGSGQARICN